MMLVKIFCQNRSTIQSNLIPWLEKEPGKMSKKEQNLIAILDMVLAQRFSVFNRNLLGGPWKGHAAIALVFIARSIYYMAMTRVAFDRLEYNKKGTSAGDDVSAWRFYGKPIE